MVGFPFWISYLLIGPWRRSFPLIIGIITSSMFGTTKFFSNNWTIFLKKNLRLFSTFRTYFSIQSLNVEKTTVRSPICGTACIDIWGARLNEYQSRSDGGGAKFTVIVPSNFVTSTFSIRRVDETSSISFRIGLNSDASLKKLELAILSIRCNTFFPPFFFSLGKLTNLGIRTMQLPGIVV